MNTQFKKGIIELCVLKLVSKKDMYGFEVIETISKEATCYVYIMSLAYNSARRIFKHKPRIKRKTWLAYAKYSSRL